MYRPEYPVLYCESYIQEVFDRVKCLQALVWPVVSLYLFMASTVIVQVLNFVVLMAVVLSSCNSPQTQQNQFEEASRIQMELGYAKRFKVWSIGEVTQIEVNSGGGSGDTLTYLLVPPGPSKPVHINTDQVIEIPVRKLVVTSTSHIPYLNLLEASEHLIGFPNTRYISSKVVRDRIDRGLLVDVGDATGLNFESLLALQPDLVVSYLSGVDRSEIDQLQQSGIPYVLNFDFMEETPLGRAEWIKFMGLLLGKLDLADSVFKEIESRYQELKRTSEAATYKPSVFSGILYGDTWFAPGARSFAARFIEDAGGSYSWNDLSAAGSVELSLEAVLDRNLHSEFWIGTGDYASKISLAQADPRYSHFKAFQEGRIYNSHKRIGGHRRFRIFRTGSSST